MLKIFTKEKQPLKLKELEIEKATEEEIKEASIFTNRWEIQNRINNAVKYLHNLPPARPDESDEEKAKRRKNLNEKIGILRQCLIEKDREDQVKRERTEAQEAETTSLRELKNVRYSFAPLIRIMRSQGTQAVPLGSVTWRTPESVIISIKCASGSVRKLDLRKLPMQYWNFLTSSRFAPLFIGIEAAGKTIDGKHTGLMQDGKFHGKERIIAFPTYLAIMLV